MYFPAFSRVDVHLKAHLIRHIEHYLRNYNQLKVSLRNYIEPKFFQEREHL